VIRPQDLMMMAPTWDERDRREAFVRALATKP
jgi:hypothetical protein